MCSPGKYPLPGPTWTRDWFKTVDVGLTGQVFYILRQVVSDSQGLVDFKISLVDSFLRGHLIREV